MDEQHGAQAAAPTGAAFGTVVRDGLPEQIANRLVSLIGERALKPGERLPPERELAAMLGVSRPSLREALRALSMIGVTEMRHGSGNFVSALEPAQLMRPLGIVLAMSESGFDELFEARKLVEPRMAALAATRATAAELERLQACVRAAEAAVAHEEPFMRADLELHSIISAAARNAILARLVDSIGELAVASRLATTTLPGMRERALRDHRRIVDAIVAGDADAASAAMLDHLEEVDRRRTAAREAAQP